MSGTIFWYDFETTGINPRADRAIQVAGLRTDENLQTIGEPLNLYCQLSDDILPHPAASLITGISVADMQGGLCEAEFFAHLHQQLAQPGTCTAGYNSIRFDDEFTRYGLYRNFYDPYAREWQNSNSRWDLLDALRCAWALRPEGINWPVNEQGRHSFRLELLTAANQIEHGQAHDALADVRATIAMARLLKQKQPQLYTYLYQSRSKSAVQQRLRFGQPCVHVSGRFAVERNCLAIVVPVATNPHNPNAVITIDLQADLTPLFKESAEQLSRRLFVASSQLAPGTQPVPVKLIQVNRCPVVAPTNVLRPQDNERLRIDSKHWQDNLALVTANLQQLADKCSQAFSHKKPVGEQQDPEQMLYDSFLDNRDRGLCELVRNSTPQELASNQWSFDDQRLPELLWRYRARNFPDSLGRQEQQQWHQFCSNRLHDSSHGAPLTISGFYQALAELDPQQQQSELMQGWLQHVRQLEKTYGQ